MLVVFRAGRCTRGRCMCTCMYVCMYVERRMFQFQKTEDDGNNFRDPPSLEIRMDLYPALKSNLNYVDRSLVHPLSSFRHWCCTASFHSHSFLFLFLFGLRDETRRRKKEKKKRFVFFFFCCWFLFYCCMCIPFFRRKKNLLFV